MYEDLFRGIGQDYLLDFEDKSASGTYGTHRALIRNTGSYVLAFSSIHLQSAQTGIFTIRGAAANSCTGTSAGKVTPVCQNIGGGSQALQASCYYGVRAGAAAGTGIHASNVWDIEQQESITVNETLAFGPYLLYPNYALAVHALPDGDSSTRVWAKLRTLTFDTIKA